MMSSTTNVDMIPINEALDPSKSVGMVHSWIALSSNSTLASDMKPERELLEITENDFQTHVIETGDILRSVTAMDRQILRDIRGHSKTNKSVFRMLQKWDGFVIDVKSDVFTARLVPIVGEEGDQCAEIYLSEIDEEDRQLLQPGTEFYWSIGYLDGPTGRQRVSSIRIRRLPVWSEGELEEALTKADQISILFSNESEVDSSQD